MNQRNVQVGKDPEGLSNAKRSGRPLCHPTSALTALPFTAGHFPPALVWFPPSGSSQCPTSAPELGTEAAAPSAQFHG